MRYKNDYPDKAEEPAAQQYMPITCGSFNNDLYPVAYSRPMPGQSGMGTGYSPSSVMVPSMPLPSGYPTGGAPVPLVPSASGVTSTVPGQVTPGVPSVPGAPGFPSPVTLESPLYTPGFLRTQIGKLMRVEFLIGTNGLTDRTGTLIGVGASYILLRLVTGEIGGGNIMMCDIYSIKFVTIVEG